MCGIAGLLCRQGTEADELRDRVMPMTEVLRHRGPDDSGYWVDPAVGVALGHRRLSIVDLSAHGHQPMTSRGGRYVLVYNGEIYNHAELRTELEGSGSVFAGTGDTEVLLEAIERWGLDEAMARCNGMFALAVWDRRDRALSFARDRLGEKPLYYGWAGPTLVFGSELKALRAHPAFDAAVDRGSLTLFFRYSCVPGDRSIYQGVRKLPPGTLLTIPETARPGDLPRPRSYWSLREVVEARGGDRRPGDPAARSDAAALNELDDVLRRAVALRMHADVPLGAFLSGGIDSSLVVALMQAQSTSKVRTFTVAFDDARYDEAGDAGRVAAHLGTEHTELLVTHDDTLAAVPKLVAAYDEPFADCSQLPTLLLSELTRRHVTVALSGDGGDELFGGYNRYVWAQGMWERTHRLPVSVRRAAGAAIGSIPPRWWDRGFDLAGPVLPPRLRVRTPSVKLQKVGLALGARDVADLHRRLASHRQHPADLVVGGWEPALPLDDPAAWPALADPVEQMMFLDAQGYLPDDILVKVDRASMSTSLETRVPYLDHHVAAWAWSLGTDLRIRSGEGKWLLRHLLHRYVPPALVERPKMGFDPPIGEWLRGPLRPWAEELLSGGRLGREGYLRAEPVRAMWDAHLSGRRDHQFELWDVLMFQAWLESQ